MMKYQDMALSGDIRPSRFISAISVIIYFYLFIGGIIVSIPVIYILLHNSNAINDILMMQNYTTFIAKYETPIVNYLFVNLSIICMLIGAIVSVKYIHKRTIRSLITTRNRISWNKYCIGFGVYGILILLANIVDFLINSEAYSYTFDAAKFWISLPIILILTPIQAATEELVFRGYIIQSFGLKINNGIILSIISGAMFTLPHLMNPEIYVASKDGLFSEICMILNYFVFGFTLALLTIKSNSLEIAIGAHTVNNLICFILLGYPDNVIPTNTVFFTSNLDPISSLISELVICIILYIISSAFLRIPSSQEQKIDNS